MLVAIGQSNIAMEMIHEKIMMAEIYWYDLSFNVNAYLAQFVTFHSL